ncbi:MAG: O-antigen ligase family protein [Patescibacteria group bacterium]
MRINTQSFRLPPPLSRIVWGGVLLTLLLPLVSAYPYFDPPPWGQVILFRMVSIFLFLSFFLFLLWSESWSALLSFIRANLLLKLLLVFAGILLLSTFFSRDPYFSFWGTPYRTWGVLNDLLYIGFALLAFFALKQKSWNILWNVAFGVGALAAFIAIFQQFGFLSDVLASDSRRPASTFGNAMFLAVFLGTLAPMLGSFLGKAKSLWKKLLYGCLFLLFLAVIVLSETRAVFIGLGVGFFFFLFFHPSKRPLLKISSAVLFGIGVLVLLTVNLLSPPSFVQQKSFLSNLWQRLTIENLLKEEPRFPAWSYALKALEERPLLGYGPYNSSIAFDAYFESGDPRFQGRTTGWWDTFHNLYLDIATGTGIVGLSIFLLFMGILFWKLHLARYLHKERALLIHGLQTAFLAYLVSMMFSFNSLATSLLFFLLIGYALSLLTQEQKEDSSKSKTRLSTLPTGVKLVLSVLLVGSTLWALSFTTLAPFSINKQLNVASASASEDRCGDAFQRFENLPSNGSLDFYINSQYIDALNLCLSRFAGEDRILVIKKAIELLKENVQIRPAFTRAWISLAAFTNLLIEQSTDTQEKELLTTEAEEYLQKASRFSPRRQQIFGEWAKVALVAGDFEKALEKAKECIALDKDSKECWWILARAELSLGNKENGTKALKEAADKGFGIYSEQSLLHIAEAHTASQDYEALAKVYEEIIFRYSKNPGNPQHHASLATVYRELKRYEEARHQAIAVWKLQPENLQGTEEFLQTLPSPYNTPLAKALALLEQSRIRVEAEPNNFHHYLNLAYAYLLIDEYEKVESALSKVLRFNPAAQNEVQNILLLLPQNRNQ